jgi:hypothetical protein
MTAANSRLKARFKFAINSGLAIIVSLTKVPEREQSECGDNTRKPARLSTLTSNISTINYEIRFQFQQSETWL